MPDALGLLMLALAAWRLAVFLVRERGPWDMALMIRTAAGIVHDDDGDPVGVPDRMPGAVLGCVWCCSAWLAWPLLLVWQAAPLTVVTLAIAGAAALLELAAGRLQRG